MHSRFRLPLAAFLAAASLISAVPGRADDSRKLRLTLDDRNAAGTDLWIYNDLDKAFEEARRQNKPLFVTFRCVPCKACAGFDAEVAGASDEIERLARDRFIPVRQVEMKGVDLSLFEFDYDLNWAAMFVNADGTVYARYGTQSAAGPDAYNSIGGLEKTMRRVLRLHEAYPKNAAELEGKRGPRKPYRTALEMPGLHNKEKRRGETTRGNCIHCHNIHDAQNEHAYETGAFEEDMLWRYPLPDNVGLVIDPADGVSIKEVREGSPAARAGLSAGEEITHADGQAITSIADIQWVLDKLPNRDTVLRVRGSKSGERELRLKRGWKRTDFSWRGSMWSLRPRLRVWTPPLGEKERRERGIPEDRAAFLVKWINTRSPGGRSARDSGLRRGDVILELAGKPLPETPQQFNMRLKLDYKVGDRLPLTVLRKGERKRVSVRLVE